MNMNNRIAAILVAVVGLTVLAPTVASAAPRHRGHQVCHWDKHYHHRVCHWVR